MAMQKKVASVLKEDHEKGENQLESMKGKKSQDNSQGRDFKEKTLKQSQRLR